MQKILYEVHVGTFKKMIYLYILHLDAAVAIAVFREISIRVGIDYYVRYIDCWKARSKTGVRREYSVAVGRSVVGDCSAQNWLF